MDALIAKSKRLLEYWEPFQSHASLQPYLQISFSRDVYARIPTDASSLHERVNKIFSFLYTQGIPCIIQLLDCIIHDLPVGDLTTQYQQLRCEWDAALYDTSCLITVALSKPQIHQWVKTPPSPAAAPSAIMRQLKLGTSPKSLLPFYGADADTWMPFGDKQPIKQILDTFSTDYRVLCPSNDKRSFVLTSLSAHFHSNLSQPATIRDLLNKNRGIVILDPLSAYHPQISPILSDLLNPHNDHSASPQRWHWLVVMPAYGSMKRLQEHHQRTVAEMAAMLRCCTPSDIGDPHPFIGDIGTRHSLRAHLNGIFHDLFRWPPPPRPDQQRTDQAFDGIPNRSVYRLLFEGNSL